MFPKDMHKGIATWYINHGPGAVNGEGTDRRIGTGPTTTPRAQPWPGWPTPSTSSASTILRLTDCRALRALHLAPLTVLRELAISGAPPDAPAGASRLDLIDLGAAQQLEELRLYGLPALRELRFAAGRPASLCRVTFEDCPALVVPAGLASPTS